MSRLRFEFEWEDPQGARIPELRATWASLAIYVDNRPVSRLHHLKLKSIRERLYLPLYPLAEWFAMNWWSLLYEYDTPWRPSHKTHVYRHALKHAREGYALPELSLASLGENIQVSWRRATLHHCDLEFLEESQASLPRSEVESSLRMFVDAVGERLREQGVVNSTLSQEWAAIKQMDAPEVDFCRVGAALGLDPHDVSDDLKNLVLGVGAIVPRSRWDTFCAAADPEQLREQLERFRTTLADARNLNSGLGGLNTYRDVFADSGQSTPWEHGYDAARRLREHLGIGDDPLPTTGDLLGALKIRPEDYDSSVKTIYDSNKLFDVLVAPTNNAGAPAFFVDKKVDNSIRFAFCRAIFGYLSQGDVDPVLVTRVQTTEQKRNRAFAAEFLAPASALRQRIGTAANLPDDIDTLAQEFGVSAFVIEHQLMNHQIVESITG